MSINSLLLYLLRYWLYF